MGYYECIGGGEPIVIISTYPRQGGSGTDTVEGIKDKPFWVFISSPTSTLCSITGKTNILSCIMEPEGANSNLRAYKLIPATTGECTYAWSTSGPYANIILLKIE